MNRTRWMTTVAFVLAALWLRTGVAWAQPSGPANVPQILNVRTLGGAGDQSRTFLTTDPITFEATYFDPNPACVGESPVLLQLLLFNLEGQLLFTFVVDGSSDEGSGYRLLFNDQSAGDIPAGNYQHIFLVRDCTSTNIFVSGFQTIRVLPGAP